MSDQNSLAMSWNAEPLGRTAAPLREQVITRMRQAIADLELKPGQRLIERELIDQLGVSRTTVREALRELTSEGLVTVVPQKGAIVAAPSLEDAADLYEIRASLEALVARRFVERASQEAIDRLGTVLDELEQVALTTTDVRAMLAVKNKFYAVLLAGANSSVLRNLLEGFQHRVQQLRTTSLSAKGRPKKMMKELRGIHKAIARRDAELAAKLTCDHVRAAAHTALASLRAET
ncbi:GntR family transcriptional regulator [Bosea sp. (in: a-proteobacteria)]|uniref:GntR family transcriptional regulator n=1 Tax=Bosea sp. (in: a-proteobacteria) TaxID=1871050 RepID=UPI00260DF0C2|nr:GntR family transcriptional regulator [Bosea sp. (in: a-proteobacteria)]MCO5091010.1 GntR family transcriptional regulator [Bosea sp. (in: a-proteobacteria)]